MDYAFRLMIYRKDLNLGCGYESYRMSHTVILRLKFLLGSIIAVAVIFCHYGIRKVGETVQLVIGDILDY